MGGRVQVEWCSGAVENLGRLGSFRSHRMCTACHLDTAAGVLRCDSGFFQGGGLRSNRGAVDWTEVRFWCRMVVARAVARWNRFNEAKGRFRVRD